MAIVHRTAISRFCERKITFEGDIKEMISQMHTKNAWINTCNDFYGENDLARGLDKLKIFLGSIFIDLLLMCEKSKLSISSILMRSR